MNAIDIRTRQKERGGGTHIWNVRNREDDMGEKDGFSLLLAWLPCDITKIRTPHNMCTLSMNISVERFGAKCRCPRYKRMLVIVHSDIRTQTYTHPLTHTHNELNCFESSNRWHRWSFNGKAILVLVFERARWPASLTLGRIRIYTHNFFFEEQLILK